jgi:hypothetical protein
MKYSDGYTQQGYSAEELTRCISKKRLEPYKASWHPSQAETGAIISYDWLQYLSSMLFIPLHYFEIALRNKVYFALKDCYELKSKFMTLPGAAEKWYEWMPTNTKIKKHIYDAIKDAEREVKRRAICPDDIIARLYFSDWVRILDEHPDSNDPLHFWSMAHKDIFPGVSGKSRKSIVAELRQINTARNRLFHYEPLWKSNKMGNATLGANMLCERYRQIMTAILWLSFELHSFIEQSGHFKRFNAAAAEISHFWNTAHNFAKSREEHTR